jgi:hypothetical protein
MNDKRNEWNWLDVVFLPPLLTVALYVVLGITRGFLLYPWWSLVIMYFVNLAFVIFIVKANK